MDSIAENIQKYSYKVTYSLPDEAYISECLKLGIMAHGESQEEAITEIKEATRIQLLMLLEDKEEIPMPIG